MATNPSPSPPPPSPSSLPELEYREKVIIQDALESHKIFLEGIQHALTNGYLEDADPEQLADLERMDTLMGKLDQILWT